jgi:nucleoside 2-deoxyribosyltransferase
LTPQSKINAVCEMAYGEERRRAWERLNLEIGSNNVQGILAADIVIAILDGQDVDSGTASEIGYARAHTKPIFGYRGDFRLSSDNEGSVVNLQVEYFIKSSGGSIYRSTEDLFSALDRKFS